MTKYRAGRRHRVIPLRVWFVLAAIIVLSLVGTALSRHFYDKDLEPLNSNQASQIFTVSSGSSVKQIASDLQNQHLIRSSWAFQLYIHSKDVEDKLQAGTYDLSSSDSLSDIVTIMTRGRVASSLVTIVPGSRIDQVRADLINDGFTPSAVDSALNPAQYASLPVMAFKPASVNSLEGLLWPDSWEKIANTPPSYIIRESLEEMGQHLTSSLQSAFASEGLTTYQGLTLASIVLQEVNKPSDQTQVAQVFLSRLHSNMMLGSDVTANYGAIIAGQSPSLQYDSPYNTLLHTGLPPTPISTVDASALEATAHPAGTNWLYFVTGDNGVTYFSSTLQQQQSNTQAYCHKLCAAK